MMFEHIALFSLNESKEKIDQIIGTKLAKKNIERFLSGSVKARLMHEVQVA